MADAVPHAGSPATTGSTPLGSGGQSRTIGIPAQLSGIVVDPNQAEAGKDVGEPTPVNRAPRLLIASEMTTARSANSATGGGQQMNRGTWRRLAVLTLVPTASLA